MSKLTSIKVGFRRSKQPVKYESEEASIEIELGYTQDDNPNLDDEVANAFDTARAHVYAQLGIGVSARPPSPAPAAAPAEAKPATKAPAKKPAAKTEAAPAKTEAAPAKTEAAPAGEYTVGDLNKAVAAKMQELSKAGKSDTAKRITDILKEMRDKPPHTIQALEPEQRTEFLKRVQELS